MITVDYRCPKGADIGNSDLTVFGIDESVVELDIRRPETQIPENLRRYGGTRTQVRAFFYGHFHGCEQCRDFYRTIEPNSRAMARDLTSTP